MGDQREEATAEDVRRFREDAALIWAHAFANAPAIPAGFHEAEENMTWPQGKPDREKMVDDICRATRVGRRQAEEVLDDLLKGDGQNLKSVDTPLDKRIAEFVTAAKAWQKEALWAKQQFELGRLFNWRKTFAKKAVDGYIEAYGRADS